MYSLRSRMRSFFLVNQAEAFLGGERQGFVYVYGYWILERIIRKNDFLRRHAVLWTPGDVPPTYAWREIFSM